MSVRVELHIITPRWIRSRRFSFGFFQVKAMGFWALLHGRQFPCFSHKSCSVYACFLHGSSSLDGEGWDYCFLWGFCEGIIRSKSAVAIYIKKKLSVFCVCPRGAPVNSSQPGMDFHAHSRLLVGVRDCPPGPWCRAHGRQRFAERGRALSTRDTCVGIRGDLCPIMGRCVMVPLLSQNMPISEAVIIDGSLKFWGITLNGMLKISKISCM